MKEKDTYWLDDPRNVNRLYWGLVVVCILLGLADLFVHRHVHFSWESFPNFYGFFGFAAFWCVVIAGKNLRKILWRPEDYYDD
jgi:uncharacterized membrane protein